jgi:superfamily II DNA/RNA helicase
VTFTILAQGIDLPDIELVVQYQLTATMCILWQRLGRSGRGPGTQATGVVIVEPKHFDDEKAKRRKAVEARAAKKRKAAHKELQQEESRKRPRKEELLPLSEDHPIPPSSEDDTLMDTTSDIAQEKIRCSPTSKRSGRAKRPPKFNSKAPQLVEAGVDKFINSHLVPNAEDRCRRRAINRYFGNPTERELDI